MKRAHRRPQTEANLLETTRHYAMESSVELAERMFGAAIGALEPIERMTGIGSTRLGQLCEIPGLRSWRITDFPIQWLYFEADDHLDAPPLDPARIRQAGRPDDRRPPGRTLRARHQADRPGLIRAREPDRQGAAASLLRRRVASGVRGRGD